MIKNQYLSAIISCEAVKIDSHAFATQNLILSLLVHRFLRICGLWDHFIPDD